MNDKPDDWLKAIEHCKDTDGLPLRKRLLFIHVDELVVSDAANEAHDADLEAMVAEGKKRRLELGYGASREVASVRDGASTAAAPNEFADAATTASGSGGASPAASSHRVTDSDGSSESGESGDEEVSAGPSGCLPELPLLDKFAVTTLVFAADFLTRIGKLERAVFEKYLQELREMSSTMADAYEHTAHCTVSFLTDTTSLKLIQRFLSRSEVTLDALYNVVLGQTVLPSWRKLEALGPFSAENLPTPEDSRTRREQKYPGAKAVVPSHLKQGVLSLLGAGPEIDTCGGFANKLAAKIPCAVEDLRQGECVGGLGLPAFRELLALRLLAVADPRLCDWGRRDLGRVLPGGGSGGYPLATMHSWAYGCSTAGRRAPLARP